MADDDIPVNFDWEKLIDELTHPDLVDANARQNDANPANQAEPYQPQQPVNFNPLPNSGLQEAPANYNWADTGQFQDLDYLGLNPSANPGQNDANPANQVGPYQPQQAVEVNPLPNPGQEFPVNYDVNWTDMLQLEEYLGLNSSANPVPNQYWSNHLQQAVEFNPLPNPGPEPPEVGLHHIQMEPLPNLGQGGDVYVEPPAFENMDVGNVQDAQNEVAMLREGPVVNHDEFFNRLLLEKEEICRRMLGTLNQTSTQWLTYLNQPDDQLEHQHLIEVYAYMNHFILDAEPPPPRHLRRNCNVDTDPETCCFYQKFGAFLAKAGNYPHSQRQVKLFNMFCAETTRVITKMFERANIRKGKTGLIPEHVHYILEEWYANKHNAAVEGVVSWDAEEVMLAAETGLSIIGVRHYKNRMTRNRYDFATQQMVPREPALPLAPPGAAVEVVEGDAAPARPRGRQPGQARRKLANDGKLAKQAERQAIIDCIWRHPGVRYKDLPREEKELLCEICNCTSEKMRDWYLRKVKQLAEIERKDQLKRDVW